ncbi:MAG: peptide chain release factor N(5)-glutamine methyltransferase [Magnetococcales bacterium]|nr:peptide chain release factor N(5)-glutamine methyltransferase [Magnetococcales bacterium]
MTAPLWTIRTLLGWSAPWLAQRGVESPRLDSELLLAEVLHLRRIDLFLDPHRPLSAAELAAFKAVIKRRAAREPVAFILGRREFWGMEFRVGPDTLIPRPETELLVEAALARFPDRSSPLTILEMCVGSGAVVCALLKEFPNATAVGTDLSAGALVLARANVEKHGFAERIALLEGDLDAPLAPEASFDLMVVNPPYVTTQELDGEVAPEVREWEPRLALDGGADGLRVVERVPPCAVRRLRPGGLLLMEIGSQQGEAAGELLARGGLVNVEILIDFNKLDRVVAGNVPPLPQMD